MKTTLLTIGFLLGGFLASSTQAQIVITPAQSVPLTIDSNMSSVEISFAGASSSSQLSGTSSLNLQSSGTLSETAQITDLNLVVDDGLNFSLFGGFGSAVAAPGDVNISLETPGAPGPIFGFGFTQSANTLGLTGDLVITDGFGFGGGSQTLDLSTLEIPPVDFNAVNLTQLGGLVTISGTASATTSVNLGTTDLPIEIEMNFFASGIVPPVLPPVVQRGDVNMSGTVDNSDIPPFIMVLIFRGFQEEADCNDSGQVNFADIFSFIGLLRDQ